jgi:hypothetical protein
MGMQRIAAALLAAGIFGGWPASARAVEEQMTAPAKTKQEVLKESMRKLWAEHVIWTRAYVVADVGGSADAEDVAARLMKNQEDIGAAFAPYYGKASGDKLAALLKRHISIAAEVVDTAKSRDAAKFHEADGRWHENARDIAVFLSDANPNWSKKEIVDMFNEHLALTTKEASSRLNKKWPDDIVAFDEILDQMMLMADDLSNGLIKQFPGQF